MPLQLSEDEATDRACELAAMAARLRKAGLATDAPEALALASEALPGAAWDNAVKAIEILCSGTSRPVDASTVPTFKTWGEMWTTGEMHKKWPDRVPVKRTWLRDEQILRVHINDVIGPIRMDRFTLNHADEVMSSLPTSMKSATRRHVAQVIHRLAKLAVYPGRFLESNPIPSGWLPRITGKRIKSHLYPVEDRQLLACKNIPLRDRLTYGFLAREGLRKGEAVRLRWADFDLGAGSVRLDQNKTDDPRAWALDAGVVRALTLWKARRRALDPDLSAEDFEKQLVFLDDAGHLSQLFDMRAEHFRAALQEAGITRPELFEDNEHRQQITAHDLRASFVTVNLANGRTEAWISDRTGHKSSVMINRYRRAARTHDELNLGTFAPLDEAIPELRHDEGPGDDNDGDAGPSAGSECPPPLPTSLPTDSCPRAGSNCRHADFQGENPC
jgi:integrase